MDACNSTYCLIGAPRGFLDAATYRYIIIIFRIIFNPAASLLALCASLINISTFFKMDLRQGVNLNLLVLSCSDCVLCLILLAGHLSNIMIWYGYSVLNGFSFSSMLSQILFLFNYPTNISIATTTVIAIVRCLSVVMPITFKSIITNKQQVVAITILGCVSISVPLYIHIKRSLFRPSLNTNTTLRGPVFLQLYPIFDLFRNTFFYTCLAIVVFSIAVLIVSLKRSLRLKSKKSSQQATRKETQAIKTVILVLAIFVGCNMPLMLLAVMRQAIPEFSNNGRYRNEKGVWDMLVGLSVNRNVGLNLFAYYSTNSTFRTIVRSQVLRIKI